MILNNLGCVGDVNSTLKLIEGAHLTEILLSETSIRLQFTRLRSGSDQDVFLSTANLLSKTASPSNDYHLEMLAAIPILYACVGQELAVITLFENRAELNFANGNTVWICDTEGLWDNLFIVEPDVNGTKTTWLYGSSRSDDTK